jgi:hypothetical protein
MSLFLYPNDFRTIDAVRSKFMDLFRREKIRSRFLTRNIVDQLVRGVSFLCR